ncbi:Elongator subunit elp2 [Homalodisca vitripennis]|nr:Elongator subunit elp2 [Homalodisca vitripennis]
MGKVLNVELHDDLFRAVHRVHSFNKNLTPALINSEPGHRETYFWASIDGKDHNGDLLLASGSQDSSVRLWRFHPTSSQRSTDGSSLPPMFRVEEKMLRLGSMELAVSLESVLLGHDGRVYGVKWHPPVLTDTGYTQPLKLLTASLDKTVVVWAPEAQSGVWLEEARMGEVGGNTLGFFGASFGPSGSAILAHSYLGGFHLWYKDEGDGPQENPYGKMEAIGMRGLELKWFRSFLSGRMQQVKVGHHLSSHLSVKEGVPQGSVLLAKFCGSSDGPKGSSQFIS